MLILYYSPGACSQAPHILLHETGIEHDARRVDLKTKKLEDGSDYLELNPKGAVPALQLESGEVLTENAVILQYIGDRTSWPEVFPPLGNFRRYRVLELVNFITTELHKRFSFLFNREATYEFKEFVKADLAKKLSWIDERLGDRPIPDGRRPHPSRLLFVRDNPLDRQDDRPRSLAEPPRFLREDAAARLVRNVLRFEGLLEEETAG